MSLLFFLLYEPSTKPYNCITPDPSAPAGLGPADLARGRIPRLLQSAHCLSQTLLAVRILDLQNLDS